MKYDIWTDGSTLKNPGPGGYAWLAKGHNKTFQGVGTEAKSTSNRAEMLAAIDALETIHFVIAGDIQVRIFSDSEYLVKGINTRVVKWIRNGWETPSGEVKNQDLWERLIAVTKTITVTFIWIKGHSGIPENEYVDKLAYKAVNDVYGAKKISSGR